MASGIATGADAFPSSLLLPEEIAARDDAIYDGVPRGPIRDTYCENEKKWLGRSSKAHKWMTMPLKGVDMIGMNGQFAVAVTSDPSTETINSTVLQQIETAVRCQLKRSKTQDTFHKTLKQAISRSQHDPDLQVALRAIMKDREFMATKTTLPTDDNNGYSYHFANRGSNPTVFIGGAIDATPIGPTVGGPFRVYVNAYQSKKNNHWKARNLTFPVKPIGYVSDDGSAVFAYQIPQTNDIFVGQYLLPDCKPREAAIIIRNFGTPINISFAGHVWAVGNGTHVATAWGLHGVENCRITAMHLTDVDTLLIGTDNGAVYSLNPKTGKHHIDGYYETHDILHITHLYQRPGSQQKAFTTCASTNLVDAPTNGPDIVPIAATNPLFSKYYGTLVFTMSIHGRISLHSNILRGEIDAFGLTTPQYLTGKGDIWIAPDMARICALYPNGQISQISIK
jgi:hypothetical protein